MVKDHRPSRPFFRSFLPIVMSLRPAGRNQQANNQSRRTDSSHYLSLFPALAIADDYVVEPDLADPRFLDPETSLRPFVLAARIQIERQISPARRRRGGEDLRNLQSFASALACHRSRAGRG